MCQQLVVTGFYPVNHYELAVYVFCPVNWYRLHKAACEQTGVWI